MATASYAQTSSGALFEIVTDPSGSSVTGAEVTLTNLGTNDARTSYLS